MADEFTVGVEEEYQLVDIETGALCSLARDVLVADWTAEIRPELQETTIEVGTRVCASAAELDRELRRLRFQVAAAAAVVDLDVAAAGVHPFSRWEGHHLSGDERYRMLAERYGRIARDEHNFGMHVHVGVPAEQDRIRLQNIVRDYVPHLIALAASSPLYEGEDTSYASYRMVLWRRWPNSGVPPRLESEREYQRFLDLLVTTGALGDKRNLYWSVRPHVVFPTLEFRMTDVCPSVEDAVAIAALVRAVVVAAATGALVEQHAGHFSESTQSALLSANEWRALRYGLDGWLVDPDAPSGRRPIRSAIVKLVDAVAPVAAELGDEVALAGIARILAHGNGSERMRRVFADRGDPRSVVSWLVGETLLGTGPDRRRSQRKLCA